MMLRFVVSLINTRYYKCHAHSCAKTKGRHTLSVYTSRERAVLVTHAIAGVLQVEKLL